MVFLDLIIWPSDHLTRLVIPLHQIPITSYKWIQNNVCSTVIKLLGDWIIYFDHFVEPKLLFTFFFSFNIAYCRFYDKHFWCYEIHFSKGSHSLILKEIHSHSLEIGFRVDRKEKKSQNIFLTSKISKFVKELFDFISILFMDYS